MIGINGSYIFIFSIGNKKDFIDEGDIDLFKIIEEAGNVLPIFQLTFRTKDDTILGLLNEGNDLEITYGPDINNVVQIKLNISKVVSNKVGSDHRRITLTGLYSALEYLTNPNLIISDKKSGVAVLKEIVEKHFESEFNISTSNDSQIWIQNNLPDKLFVNELWFHSYVPNSFIAVGVSTEGKYILKDMKKALASGIHDWKFTPKIVDTVKDIAYDGDHVLEDNSGFINNWFGYGRKKLVYNLEAGTDQTVSEEALSLLSLVGTLPQKSGIVQRLANIGMLNDNVHINYWKAYMANITNLVMFGSVKLSLKFSGVFKPLKILDLIMLKDDQLGAANQASESYSGLFVVSKVVRSLHDRVFTTTVQCVRESVNAAQGTFR